MTSRNANSINVLVAAVRAQRPGIAVGTGRSDPDSDHDFYSAIDSQGIGVVRAADIMTTAGDQLAQNLAAKLRKHPAMGPGAYVIWKQRIISADRLSEGWRTMEDRGSPTANHMDHVHVSVATAQAGYDYKGPWGALFTGSGTGAAPTPGGPAQPLSTPPTGSLSVSAAVAGQNGGNAAQTAAVGIPGASPEQLKEYALVGALLFLGVALIGIGASRVAKPAVNEVIADGQSAALLAVPPAKAAGVAAAATATKGTS